MTRILSTLAALATLVAAPSFAQDAPELELKGFRVGMAAEDAKSVNPDAACEVLGPDLERCTNEDASLNERKARLEVFLMDGKLVMASFQRLQTRHSQDIALLLAEKFGPPTSQWNETRWHMGSQSNERRQKSIWDRNGVQLQVLPFAFEDVREQNTFASVRIVDAVTWDQQWLPRLRAAQEEQKNGKRTLSRADI